MLLAILAVLVALITIFTNGAFYMVGTGLLAGGIAVFLLVHSLCCRCPHCGKHLPISGDESHTCHACGQPLPPSQTKGTYSGLYYQEL